MFGVILGTGCGGGVVVDRKVVEGASGIGGEWGHTPLPWARADEVQPRDWCGRVGLPRAMDVGHRLQALGRHERGRSR